MTLSVTSLSFNLQGSSSPSTGALAFKPATTITDTAVSGHAAFGTFTTAGTFRLF